MADTKSKEVSIREIIGWIKEAFSFLKKKLVWLIIAAVIGGLGGYLYAINQKVVYTATLSFALEDDKAGGGGLSGALGLASQFGIDLGGSAGGAFSGGNLMELMRSRSLVEKTLLRSVTVNGKKESIADFYIDIHHWRNAWQQDPLLKDLHYTPDVERKGFTLQQDSVLAEIFSDLVMNKRLFVNQKDKKISIIEISVKSPNELFAKTFVEELAGEVSEFYIDTKTKRTANNVAILQKQTDSIRSELNGAINGVAAASDNTFNLNPALNIRRVPSQRRQVDVQANTAILTELVKNLELAKVTLRRETPLIQIIDTPILPLEKTIFSKKKGIVFGAAIFGFLTAIILLSRKAVISLNRRYA